MFMVSVLDKSLDISDSRSNCVNKMFGKSLQCFHQHTRSVSQFDQPLLCGIAPSDANIADIAIIGGGIEMLVVGHGEHRNKAEVSVSGEKSLLLW